MIPHFIDLLCRGLSLAVLIWGVFSMGFASAERKSAPAGQLAETVDQQEVEPALRAGSARGGRGPDHSEVEPSRFKTRFPAYVSQRENGGPAPGSQSLDQLGTLSPSNGPAEPVNHLG
jgi:hypothetical protein